MMRKLPGVVDLHVHTAPDLVPRTNDDLSLAREARSAGMRAVVIKAHGGCTAARAAVASQVTGGVAVFGGLALNWPVGGLNPNAVDASLRMGAKVIWLPTLSAAHHQRVARSGFHDAAMAVYRSPRGGIIVLDEEGRLRGEAIEILDLVAKSDVMLATGHLSQREIEIVVAEARRRKVGKIVVTHPEHPLINLSVDQQRRLRHHGAVFERCYVSTLLPESPVTLANIAEQIQALGARTTVLATDLGAAPHLPPVAGMRRYMDGLAAAGIGAGDLDWMTSRLPAALLGL